MFTLSPSNLTNTGSQCGSMGVSLCSGDGLVREDRLFVPLADTRPKVKGHRIISCVDAALAYNCHFTWEDSDQDFEILYSVGESLSRCVLKICTSKQ